MRSNPSLSPWSNYPGALAVVAAAGAFWLLTSLPGQGFAAVSATAGPTSGEAQGPAALLSSSAESRSPVLSSGGSLPAPDALRQGPVTPTNLEGSSSPVRATAAPKAGVVNGPLPRWLSRPGTSGPTYPRPSVQVLFCTWLA